MALRVTLYPFSLQSFLFTILMLTTTRDTLSQRATIFAGQSGHLFPEVPS